MTPTMFIVDLKYKDDPTKKVRLTIIKLILQLITCFFHKQ